MNRFASTDISYRTAGLLAVRAKIDGKTVLLDPRDVELFYTTDYDMPDEVLAELRKQFEETYSKR